MPKDVFISYATEDQAAALELRRRLEARAIACWIAPRDVPAGVPYAAAIVEAIERTRVFVLILSEQANASPHIQSEVERAFHHRRTILTLRIANVAMSPALQYYLGAVHWIESDSDPFDEEIGKLEQAVAAALAAPPEFVPPPVASRLRRYLPPVAAGLALVAVAVWIGVHYRLPAESPAGLEQKQPMIEPPVRTSPPVTPESPAPRVEPVRPTVRVNPRDGLRYVRIPPGRFRMGCSEGDPDCEEDEFPARQIEIAKAFWLGETEVTVEAYRRYAQARALTPPEGEPRHPVTGVNRAEAKAYCTAAGGRLPAEAEWEYAARAGATDRLPARPADHAWFGDSSGETVHPVGAKAANAFGLYDMLGNVAEWVADRYYNRYDDEDTGAAPEEPVAGGALGAIRGGFFAVDRKWLRFSNRQAVWPDMADLIAGFRCALDKL